MRILEPRVTCEESEVVYRAAVETRARSAELWFRVPREFGDLVSQRADAALASLLLPAMAAGEDIEVGGVVSEKLVASLSGPFQRLVRLLLPSLHRSEIRAQGVRAGPRARAPGLATGFSAGVDSYCVLADRHFGSVPGGLRITHLLFNNVGSHGEGGERLFRVRLERLLPIAAELGLPIVPVNSNLDTFYERELDFQSTHTVRNLSVPLLLQDGIDGFLYASTFSFADLRISPTYDMAYADPVILPLFSTETLGTESAGGEYTRVEKTLRVAELPIAWRTLDVCVHSARSGQRPNCSTCWKCLRTLATLEIAGKLELFESSFDLERYRGQRESFFGKLTSSDDPLLEEVVAFAESTGFELPASSRLLASHLVQPIASLARRARARLKRNR